MLEFGTVDLDDRVGLPKEHFRRCLDNAGFSRTGRSKEQHSADGAGWIIHSRQINLEKPAHASDRAFLTDDQCRQLVLKLFGPRTLPLRIKQNAVFRSLSSFGRFVFHTSPSLPLNARKLAGHSVRRNFKTRYTDTRYGIPS